MHPNSCSICNAPWYEDQTIYEYFLNKGETPKEAARIAAMYGCTPEHPKHFGLNIIGIETPDYDGVSQWKCTSCNSTFDRWTMKPISESSDV